MPRLACEMQGCPKKLVSGINTRALMQEEFTHLQVALPCSDVQRAFLAVLLNCIEYLIL
jgi:hypothetical protein